MTGTSLYPLRFTPILQYRLWGGHRLAELFGWQDPATEPIGEAWLLSDRDDNLSRVADGPLQGKSIHDIIDAMPRKVLGRHAGRFRRFPLLLKFLDAREMLSVQVHPGDQHQDLLPTGEQGKTEAWLVLESEPTGQIFAGLKPETSADDLRRALAEKQVPDLLAGFAPRAGDGIVLWPGTVHALGGGVVLFEVQQNSDVTFRLYDWDRVDSHTGQPRTLHVEQALACTDYSRGPVSPVTPAVEARPLMMRELLFDCPFFRVWRVTGMEQFSLGAADECRVVVGLRGQAELAYSGGSCQVSQGDGLLLPAELEVCTCQPDGPASLLEIAIPD